MPPTLYKYAKPERMQDVAAMKVRFTQASAQNDPFELQPIFDIVATSSAMWSEVEAEAPSLIRAGMAKNYEVLAPEHRALLPDSDSLSALFVASGMAAQATAAARNLLRPLLAEKFRELREHAKAAFTDGVAILSLAEDPQSVTMWSHYGDSHRGIAFEFDTSHPWFDRRPTTKSEFFHLRPVRYVDLKAQGRTFLQIADENLLLTKGLDWSSEHEWRILASVKDAVEICSLSTGEPLYLFALDPGAVSAIIVGLRASDETIVNARKLVRSSPRTKHIRLRRVRQSQDTATLQIVDM